MRRGVFAPAIALFLTVAARASADSVTMKDGTALSGTIVEETPAAVTIKTDARKETIPRDEIKAVTHGDAAEANLDDEIVLSDGTTLHGKITGEKAGSYVIIAANGRIETIAWSEIAKRGKVPAPEAPKPKPAAATGERVILADGTTVEGHIGDHEWGKYVVVETASGAQRYEWSKVARVVMPASIHYAGSAVHLTKEKNGGYQAEAGGTFSDAAEARKAWLSRGGSILGFDAQGDAVALYWKTHGVTVTGFGGGVGLHATFYYLSPPDPTKSESTWFGVRAGAGVDSTGFIAHASGGGGTVGIYGITIPFSLGAQAGFGTYRVFEEWNGVMVGADWRPSYAYNKSSLAKGSGSWNYLGFQLTADFVRFKTIMDRYEKALKEPHWRVSLFVLPPVDDLPLLLEIGLGAAWY